MDKDFVPGIHTVFVALISFSLEKNILFFFMFIRKYNYGFI